MAPGLDRLRISNVELRQADAEVLEVPSGTFDAATARWSLQYMSAPERVEYASLWRWVLARYSDVPPVEMDRPGVFRFSSEEAIRQSLHRCGFTVDSIEERRTAVVEADTGKELVAWHLDLWGSASAA